MLSEEQRNGGSSIGSSQNRVEVEVEEEATLVAIQEIRTSNNKKANPMEEDVVTLEVGQAKEDAVHGKGTSS